MNPRSTVTLALGLLAGGAFTILAQACYSDCSDVEPLRFQTGDYALDQSWGEVTPHPVQDRIDASLDLKTNTLAISYDSPEGFVEETWTIGGIDIW